MSGHSKWANIKHRKAAQDVKKSKIFQKLSKEILVAIQEKGNDPEKNNHLQLAIEKAKSQNMPNDNIKKLLLRNQKDTSNWQELRYEGYGPEGIAIIVECLTDNLNRTSAQVKAAFTKLGGNLGITGSVSYMFEKLGIIILDKSIYHYDKIFDILIESNVLDIIEEEETILIKTPPNKMLEVKEVLMKNGIDEFITTEVTEFANQTVNVSEEKYQKVERLITALENLEDVQNVHTNLE